MHRHLLAVIVLLLFVGFLAAGDATVVSYSADTMKLVVTAGGKERTLELKKGTHVHDVDGKEVSLKDRADKLKKGVLIEIEEKDGKLIEINIKKK